MAHLRFIGWQVGVGGRGAHVVEEGEMFPDVLCPPVAKERVEQPLVAAVEGSLLVGRAQQRLEKEKYSTESIVIHHRSKVG